MSNPAQSYNTDKVKGHMIITQMAWNQMISSRNIDCFKACFSCHHYQRKICFIRLVNWSELGMVEINTHTHSYLVVFCNTGTDVWLLFSERYDDELDLLDDFEEFYHYSKRKSAKQSKPKKCKYIVGKSRKRIRQISGSSSEEETRVATSVLENTQADGHGSHLLCSQRNKPIRKKVAAILSSSEEEISPKCVAKSLHHASHTTSLGQAGRSISPQQKTMSVVDTDMLRQERLAKQKQKQEEFRQKMSKKNGRYEDRLVPRTDAPISGSAVDTSRRLLDVSRADYDFASDKLSSVIPKSLVCV